MGARLGARVTASTKRSATGCAGAPAEIVRKAFRGSEFLYTLRLASGELVMAHVPSHHHHHVGELIGIRAEVDHVVTFPPEPPAATFSEPNKAAALE